MNKKSLGQEVSKLKSLLEVAAASTSVLSTKSPKSNSALNDEEDDDMDVSFIREEVSAQKEIIISRDQTIEKLQREIDCLNGRIGQLKEESETTKECFEAEKTHWIDEKEKVIRYQKQLQLNYVQMYKRNKTLEAEIEILNKSIEDLTSQLAMAKATPPEPLPAPPATAKTQSRLQKTGNSVRARLFKMSLHSESQC